MATSIKLKGDIKKIEAAIKSKATPKTLVPKLEAQLDKLKSDLASLSSAKPKKGVTKTKVLSSLQKLKAKIKATKSLSGYKKSGIDIKKDADIPALPLGKRTAKTTGNTYYEYRLNRADVKQPPKRYPKLEDGGMMEHGGMMKHGGMMAKGGESQGYDDREDERLAMEYGKMAKKDLKSTHSRRDDARFEEREPKVVRGYSDDEAYEYAKGGALEHGLMVGDKITSKFDNVVVVENDGKTFVVNINVGKRWSENEWYSLNHSNTSKYSKMANGGMMAQGGRTTSAINRDRAYKSNQPWEQNYQRKSNPKNPKYKSSSDFFEGGGEMHRLFEDGEA
jgi:hypothetical protein